MSDVNISSNKDNSKCCFNQYDQQNISVETPQDISGVKTMRKRRKRSLNLKELYFNDTPEQKEQSSQRENDRSTMELQGVETALNFKDQALKDQSSTYIKGYSEDAIHDITLNDVDPFSKMSNRQSNHNIELPPLKIIIRPSMNTRPDSEDLKNSQVSQTNNNNASPGLKRWRKLSIIMKSIQAFQKSEIKPVKVIDIEEEIKNSPSPRKKKDQFPHKAFTYDQDYEMTKILDNYRRVEELSQLCQNGSPSDIERIKSIFQNDPKRYIRSPEDPEHLVNKLNTHGLFPLYIACKNQNVEVVKFLLKVGAIPNIKTKNQETCLEVAARWRYVKIVQILLEHESKFETKEIEKSRKACENHQEITELLHEIILKRSKNIFKYCFPCLF